MSNTQIKPSEDLENTEEDSSQDFSKLSAEQQAELIANSLEDFCNRLESAGVDLNIINTMLIYAYTARMAELGDRDSYVDQLEELLDEPWEEHTVH